MSKLRLLLVLLLLLAQPAWAGFPGSSLSGWGIVQPISITGSTKILTGVAGKRIQISVIDLVLSAADNIALVEGTGTTCGTNTAGMAGGTTAGAGWNFTTNQLIFSVGDGNGLIFMEATAGDDVCLLVSTGAQVSGSMTWGTYP